MNREEHLQWCKDRAMVYVRNNDLKNAFASFASDMRKHPETSNHLALGIGTRLMMNGNLNSQSEMEKWILGFN